MPKAPLPPELENFVKDVHFGVVGTVRHDGAPVTTTTWYRWDQGRLLLSMSSTGPRVRSLRAEPRVALTILGENPYEHVSILGRVVEIRDDPDFSDMDPTAIRYTGKPWEERDAHLATVVIEPISWHSYGDPGGSGSSPA
jgi:general stress protein 26